MQFDSNDFMDNGTSLATSKTINYLNPNEACVDCIYHILIDADDDTTVFSGVMTNTKNSERL